MIDTPAGVFLEEISSAFLGWTDIRERGEGQEDVVRARGATLPGSGWSADERRPCIHPHRSALNSAAIASTVKTHYVRGRDVKIRDGY